MRSLLIISGLLLCVIVGISGCGGSSGSSSELINVSPKIVTLQASPTSNIPTGGSVNLTCIAEDENNDPLAYAWSANSGTLSGVGMTFTWQAPATAGKYVITCTVTDGKGGSVTDDISITVVKQIPAFASFTASPGTIGNSGGEVTLRTRVNSVNPIETVRAEITFHDDPSIVVPVPMTGTGDLYEGKWTAPANTKQNGATTTYIVRYTATDIHGNTGQSTAIYIIVEGLQLPPPFPNI